MYGKCGKPQEAHRAFDWIRQLRSRGGGRGGPTNDVAGVGLWSAVIHAYGINGDAESALSLFEEMTTGESKVQPNDITLLSILNAAMPDLLTRHWMFWNRWNLAMASNRM